MLDTRLNVRNHEVVYLQKDNNENTETICNLRKQAEISMQHFTVIKFFLRNLEFLTLISN